MRPPEELSAVAWSSFVHAHGRADDIPGLIKALYSEDEDDACQALDELCGSIVHQGTAFPAAEAAVPFLAHAAVHVPSSRDLLLMLLAETAGSGRLNGDARAQVTAEMSCVLPFLRDPSHAVRRAAIRVAAACPAAYPAVREELLDLYENDQLAEIRADALTALSLTGSDPDSSARREQLALRSEIPSLRFAAAVLLLELHSPPRSPILLRTLTEGVKGRVWGWDELSFPFPGIGDIDERIDRIIQNDPVAAQLVADARREDICSQAASS
ncbi:hypothetical protein ABZV60_16820 [Streptomyces sp. NPDC004787]|uniref:hypothetical protein n=1 Tax=Streptomyces sp. NPDC004787 TaxID=3154291 RepID=UPI0033BD1877